MRVSVLLRPAAAAVLSLVLSAPFAVADDSNTITVMLWDKGADAQMAMNMGLGMGGDHTMSSMGLKLSQNRAKAGDVTFKVANTSQSFTHEMLVIPYPADGKLPYSDKDGKFDEDAAKSQGEVSELDPGKAGSATLHLAPGKYIKV